MNFSEALGFLKKGRHLAREGWNGKDMYIFLLTPLLEDQLPYICMYTADKKLVPWLASQTDLLADDWLITSLITGNEDNRSEKEAEESLEDKLSGYFAKMLETYC